MSSFAFARRPSIVLLALILGAALSLPAVALRPCAAWGAEPRTDADMDGYGSPASPGCTHPGKLLGNASASDPIDDLRMSVDMLTPPLQSDGLDLGGVVTFSNPRLFAIDQGGDPAFQEFLGLTGDITP